MPENPVAKGEKNQWRRKEMIKFLKEGAHQIALLLVPCHFPINIIQHNGKVYKGYPGKHEPYLAEGHHTGACKDKQQHQHSHLVSMYSRIKEELCNVN